MHICFDRTNRALNDQTNADGRRQMHDYVTRIDQFGKKWDVLHRIDRIVETRIGFQMANVVDASRREIVDDENLVATGEKYFAEVRSDEAGTACDEHAHRRST